MTAQVIIWFPDSGERIHVELESDVTTAHFKELISEASGIPSENFNISFEGTLLKEDPDTVVTDFGVGPDAEIVVTIKPERIAKNTLLKERRGLTQEDFFNEISYAGDQILTYIEAGFDVNAQNFEGLTPLSLACENRRTRTEDVVSLFRFGASPHIVDYADVTPLMKAAANKGPNQLAILSRLLEEEFIDVNAKCFVGTTALNILCKNESVSNLQSFRLMLSHPKLDLTSESESKNETLLHALSLNKSPNAAEMMSLILQNQQFPKLVNQTDTHNNTALMYAVSNPSEAALEMTEMLIAHGADPSIAGLGGVTPIMRCCRVRGGYHKIDILKLILDPSLYKTERTLEEVVNTRRGESTALTEAITLGTEDGPDVVSMLLAAGADVGVGFTDSAIINCCELQHEFATDMLQTLLVVPNIDLNIKINQKTPLTAAALNNSPTNSFSLTEALLLGGARPSETEIIGLRQLVERSQPEPVCSQILNLYDAIREDR